MKALFVALFLSTLASAAYVPGTPGGPWSEEDLQITREKIIKMMECQQTATEYGKVMEEN